MAHRPIKVSALVIRNINFISPPVAIRLEKWIHLNQLLLADPEFYRARRVDLILGADIYGHLILDGVRRTVGKNGQNSCDNSILNVTSPKLGYVFRGYYRTTSHCENHVFVFIKILRLGTDLITIFIQAM